MVQEEKDRVVNTDRKIEEQSYKREPHERDESPDGQGIKPRGIIKQAAEDLQQGLVDTDARETPGASAAVTPAPDATGQANPQPDRNRDMRDHDSTLPDGGRNR
jgi:hypothetical protein